MHCVLQLQQNVTYQTLDFKMPFLELNMPMINENQSYKPTQMTFNTDAPVFVPRRQANQVQSIPLRSYKER